MRRELLIGCGNRRDKVLHLPEFPEWGELTTLDADPECKPDTIFDLVTNISIPFTDDRFSEIHAYEVLEHCGQQGDFGLFFHQFSEFWRILEPGGFFFATVPHQMSLWAWGDPSHTRIINRGSLTFLDQTAYTHVGKTPMSDFRKIYKADFALVNEGLLGEDKTQLTYFFVLQAIKPARHT